MRLEVNSVTTPKLPPPPRIAQKRSGFSSALAVTCVAVGEHDLRREQVVDRQAVAAGEVAVPAAERQARDAGRGDDPAGHGEPVLVRGGVDLAPEAAAADADGSCLGIDGDRLQQREIADDAVVDAAEAAAVVAAAADRERQVVLARERDRRRDVLGARAPRDQRRGACRSSR